jgi:hypothetical protein
MMRRLLSLLALSLLPGLAAAQSEVPSLRWQTIRTAHFRIHYEPELEAWARSLAARMESVRAAVAARVGYTPPQVIDIVVEDPFNVPNGSAWPSLFTPAMRFWATPPQPSSTLSGIRGWAEVLAVHEYAHLAHLLRPSREPGSRALAFVSGIPVGPITFLPAWVSEGYATLIEGELTGAGRPNNVSRPAILRQLALEGFLPSYTDLDNTDRFNGGAMRYLVGSAYLEWLQAQRGDSALPHLWRRATARKPRKFPESFSGVFGDAPEVLYGRFTSELTARAHAVRAALAAEGLVSGALVQHWTWQVGAPAVAPAGDRIAVRRSAPNVLPRIQVLSLVPAPVSKRDSTRIARRYERDPEDVPPIEVYPRPLRVLATLGPVGGAAYDAPRWFRDGTRMLVTRAVPRPDGRVRPDLFEWNTSTGAVRRVTRGAGILQADPLPDGRAAAALTCGAGTCSVVIVDLASGRVRPLATGGLDQAFAGVRVSPNGARVVSARQRGEFWDLVVIDIASGALRVVGPRDGASRHTATWADDSTVVAVSEASGVAVVERIPLADRAVAVVARTTGAAGAPDVGPDGRVWWLDLHGRGFDLRVSDSTTAAAPGAVIDTAQFPAARRVNTRLAQHFDSAGTSTSARYGIGTLGVGFAAVSTSSAEGDAWAAGLNLNDVLGRLGIYGVAGDGTGGTWRGGRVALTYRGLPAAVQLQGFVARQDVSEQRRLGGPALIALDTDYRGVFGALTLARHGVRGVTQLRMGGSTGTLDPDVAGASLTRAFAFGALRARRAFTPSPTTLITAAFDAHYAAGDTEGSAWNRTTAELALSGGPVNGAHLGVRAQVGEANADAIGFEQFSIGGSGSPYFDDAVLSQRIYYPAFPIAARGGRRFAILTAETTGPIRVHHDWVAAGSEYGIFTRVTGVEFVLDVPRLAVFRLPAGRASAGVSHVLNAPLRNATIGYVTLRFDP